MANRVLRYRPAGNGQRGRLPALWALLAVAFGACSDRTSSIEPSKRVNPAFLTGAAAAALQPNGQFAFNASVVRPDGQVSEEQAKLIASRYMKDMTSWLSGHWSKGHGGVVEPAALLPCERALYASSPYVSVSGNISEQMIRTFGPHWIVPMCTAGGQLQVVVTFSALATDLLKAPIGTVAPWDKAHVSSYGIPTAATWVFSPEQAASYAYAQTGKRIQSVPQLVRSPSPESAALVRWRIDFEGPVRTKGTESAVSRSQPTLFVGFGPVFSQSGLLDLNPKATTPSSHTFMDPVTKSQLRPVFSVFAPGTVELVRPEKP